MKLDWQDLELTAFLPAGVDDPTSRPSYHLSRAASGPVPACAATGGLPCGRAVHTVPDTARRCRAKHTPVRPAAHDASLQQEKKRSPFKNRPSWAPGADKNEEARGVTLSTSVRSGHRKCGVLTIPKTTPTTTSSRRYGRSLASVVGHRTRSCRGDVPGDIVDVDKPVCKAIC